MLSRLLKSNYTVSVYLLCDGISHAICHPGHNGFSALAFPTREVNNKLEFPAYYIIIHCLKSADQVPPFTCCLSCHSAGYIARGLDMKYFDPAQLFVFKGFFHLEARPESSFLSRLRYNRHQNVPCLGLFHAAGLGPFDRSPQTTSNHQSLPRIRRAGHRLAMLVPATIKQPSTSPGRPLMPTIR